MIELLARLFRFGLVGLTAAGVHFIAVIYLVQAWSYEPLIANILAFFLSFQVSYFGHRFWTFHDADVLHRDAAPKWLFVQVLGMAANEALYYVFLSFHLPYQLALILVLSILPIFTFISSRLWVFR